MSHTVHIASLGCARNDVDTEELAARLEVGGFALVGEADEAETVVVNTCGFVEQAKKDSIDTLLAAADLKDHGHTKAVVAVGCMAERYGVQLAKELPEADAVLGFDDYEDIADKLRLILSGERPESHVPRDRRTLLPLAPAERAAHAVGVAVPGHAPLPAGLAPATGPRALRRRLGRGPSAALKVASGCDRRCSFCAIPAFRGSYLSRPIADLVAETQWLVEQGVKEVFLVSENTSSYGKDLDDAELPALLSDLSLVDGLEWIRVSYLQPAEIKPGLIEQMLEVDKVVPYFDLSFQHAAPRVLRAMRRFGDPISFMALIQRIRALAPDAGIRSNVIAGFPGETDEDVEILRQFIIDAQLDVLGVFGYSDEDGTEAVGLPGKLDATEIEERRALLADVALEMCEARAADRIGERTTVLVDEIADEEVIARGRHQAPETDGVVYLPGAEVSVGDVVDVTFVDSEGIDLIGEPV